MIRVTTMTKGTQGYIVLLVRLGYLVFMAEHDTKLFSVSASVGRDGWWLTVTVFGTAVGFHWLDHPLDVEKVTARLNETLRRRCDGFEYPEPGHKVPCNEKATYLGSTGAFCSFHTPRGGCVRLDAI